MDLGVRQTETIFKLLGFGGGVKMGRKGIKTTNYKKHFS